MSSKLSDINKIVEVIIQHVRNSAHVRIKSEDLSSDLDSEMTDSYIKIGVAEKLLIKFDGNKEMLHEFIDNCENALELVSESDKILLFKIIKSKLTGKARLMSKYRQLNNFDDFKSFLEEVFTEKRSAAHWQLELNSCKQLKSESVINYSQKIEKYCNKLIENCTENKDLSIATELSNLLRQQAKNVFISGLLDNLKIQVKARNPSTLSDAIELAVAEEREFLSEKEAPKFANSKFLSSKNNIKCNNCNKIGHYSSQCFLKQKFATQSNIKSEARVNYVSDICFYCKKSGHRIANCIKRINREKRGDPKTSGNLIEPSVSGTHSQEARKLKQSSN